MLGGAGAGTAAQILKIRGILLFALGVLNTNKQNFLRQHPKWAKNILFLRFSFAEPIFAQGVMPKIFFLFAFFFAFGDWG